MKKKNYIALIPARSGSMGLKNKNLMKINNKTLIEIAVSNLINSKIVKNIYVSSNSKKILNLAKSAGANIIKRPEKYSNNKSTASQVVKHFLSKIKTGMNDHLIYLQPSSPLKDSKHIVRAIKLFEKKRSNTLLSCYYKDSEKFFKSFVIKKKRIRPLFGKLAISNRQSLKKLILPNGAIYIIKITKNVKSYGISFIDCIPYIMKENEVIDINNIGDLKMARKIFKKN
tara:strand:+ start:1075 stop:1758 length:684 start_codon:yes stop_codon:yes gene_type:complete